MSFITSTASRPQREAAPIAVVGTTADQVLLILRGDLDLGVSWELDVWLDVAMEGRRRVVLELSGLGYADEAVRGVITRARERFRQAGGDLLVRSPPPELERPPGRRAARRGRVVGPLASEPTGGRCARAVADPRRFGRAGMAAEMADRPD